MSHYIAVVVRDGCVSAPILVCTNGLIEKPGQGSLSLGVVHVIELMWGERFCEPLVINCFIVAAGRICFVAVRQG